MTHIDKTESEQPCPRCGGIVYFSDVALWCENSFVELNEENATCDYYLMSG